MNLFQIDFEQLYRRHLCRHGHFGINVLHLVAVAGIYIALFGIVANMSALAGLQQHSVITLLILLSPWFTTVAFNVPLRIAFFTGLFVGILLAIYSALPMIPTWAWLIVVFAMHRFQQYSHQLYHMDRDMTAFDRTYPKGPGRFVLLLVYELPILLEYLLFGRPDWVMGRSDMPNDASLPQATESVRTQS